MTWNERVQDFWSKIQFTQTGCWLWTAATCRGYGRLKFNGEPISAHVFSYELFIGPVPDGSCVLHSCDVRNCIRPGHLFLGTQLDNIADMVAKGRQRGAVGTANGSAILNEQKVIQIRSLQNTDMAYHQIGSQFGVSQFTVQAIMSRKIWKHVP